MEILKNLHHITTLHQQNEKKMKFKNANGTLEIEINQPIEFGWTNSLLRGQTDAALNKGVKSVNLYLSTPGGSVYEAVEIVNQLKRFETVEIICGALVASAGTYIMAHFPTKAYSNSQFMIHKPSTKVSGNEDAVKADLKALENLTNDFRKVYAERFGKTEDEINELWKNDCWLNAQEAQELGLVNDIIDGQPSVDEDIIAMMTACGCPVIPTIENQKSKKEQKMDRDKLIASLGLSADATDEQIEAKIEALKKNAESNQTEAKKKAEKLVNRAIKDKRITTESADAYIKLATENYEQTKTALESLPTIEAGSTHIDKGGNPATDRSNWTLEDYLEKDPQAYDNLIANEPEKAKALNAQYAEKR